MTIFLRLSLIFAVGCIVTACGRYAVLVNSKILYEPPALFSGFSVGDDALRECIKASIVNQNLTSAEQLKRLFCPAGEIRSLSGLEVFSRLEYLGLSDNNIQNVAPLRHLAMLAQVDLSNNDIVDFSPLHSLAYLLFINVRGNSHAACDGLAVFSVDAITKIQIPVHCE
ncbi:MAG: hypothetical protein COA42_06625 [Alteromonadaceae bacterium]|nr:MAG: hypothetical protein COA42_06625 [Alteromonadaceae bacterium]